MKPANGALRPLEGKAYRDMRGRWRSAGRCMLASYKAEDTALTNERIGEWCGVTHQTISLILAGEIRPKLDLALAFETRFSIPMKAWCYAPEADECKRTCERDDASDLKVTA